MGIATVISKMLNPENIGLADNDVPLPVPRGVITAMVPREEEQLCFHPKTRLEPSVLTHLSAQRLQGRRDRFRVP
jgi:hypothetical protein